MKEKLINEDVSQANDVEETEATEALETNGVANLSASDGEQPENAEVTEHQEDITTDKDLPPGVTEEPQDPEHMDLRRVPEYSNWVSAYLNVSDDEGHQLGNPNMEKEVKTLCKDLSSMDLTLEESHNLWIDRITDLVLRYDSTINERENTTAAIFGKYKIRLGMLHNFQKELVKHRLKQNWTKWFPENYKTISLRSAQEYMRIAEYKGAIKFAVFGTQRLLQIVRQIGKPDGTDQIEKFLEENGIDFNPEVETDYEELRTATDIAITRQKLNKEDLEDITDDIVEDLVQNGIYLTKGHLRNIKLLKDRGDDLPEYIGKLIDAGGKVKSIETPESKAKLFKRNVDRFLDQADTALNDDQYLGEVDVEIIQRITEKIRQIEQKLASLAN